MRWLTVAALLCACAGGPRPPRPATVLAASRTAVPFRMLGESPLVPVTVAGAGPFWFVLDTGAARTAISTRVQHVLGRHVRRGTARVTGADGRVTRLDGVARIPSLAVGAAEIRDVLALVADLGPLEARAGTAVDGILAFGLFDDLLMTIDYPGRQLVLERGRLPFPDATAAPDVVPYRLQLAGVPAVSVGIEGAIVEMRLDTGSDACLQLPATMEASLSFVQGPVDTGGQVFTIGGLAAAADRLGRLRGTVHLGPHAVIEPMVTLARGGVGQVGGALLRHFALTFDQGERRVRLRRDGAASLSVPGLRRSGVAVEKRDGRWTVQALSRRTAAMALDIRVGDEVVSANGRPADGLSYQDWQDLLAEDALVLVLARDGVSVSVTVPVQDLLPPSPR